MSSETFRGRSPAAALQATVLVLLTALRLWLDAGIRLRAEPGQTADDGLYARLAQSILRGEWLGSFDHLTLCKAPGYPLWIALTHALGVPLLIAQSALHVAAGLALLLALRGAGLRRGFAVVLYALYLFNPFIEVRLLREGIFGSLLVLTVAGGVAFATRLRSGRPALWPALTLGLATAAAWLTREENVMVLPPVIVVVAPAILVAWRQARDARARATTACMVAAPALVVLAAVGAVSLVNLRTYGVFRVNDELTPPFSKAFGAILSVRHSRPIPYLQVPPDVRAKLYRASSSYASLAPYIDGTSGSASMRADWRVVTCNSYPHICGEIGANWAMWLFRQAVHDAGHYRTAADADRFLEAVAGEIDAACRVGTLACDERRSSVLPPLAPGDLSRTIHYVSLGTRWVLQVPVSDYVFDPSDHSPTDADGVRLLRELTGSPVRPPEGDAGWVDAASRGEPRLAIFRWLTTGYQLFLGPLAMLAAVLLVAWAVVSFARRRLPCLLMVAVALAVGFGTRIVLLGYVHAVLFPAFGNWPSYVTPLYPTLLLFVGVTLAGTATEAIEFWRSTRAARAVTTGGGMGRSSTDRS